MREWVERRCTTTGSTLTRRCAPASPWQGEASLCCFVGNSRQRSVRSLHRANPAGGQCRGDPVGRPAGPWWAGWVIRGRGARSCQGDAPPRRPYMSCAAVCVAPTNIAARGRTRCRGGSRNAPTTPRDVHGANAAMRAHVHAMVFGSTAAPCPYNFTVLAFSSPACAAATILSRRTSPPTCRSTAQAEIQLSRLYQPEVTGKL